MIDIRKIIHTVNPYEARAALYYVSRFVKQAGLFHKYEKDIFVDGKYSAPSEQVRDLSHQIISDIEVSLSEQISEMSQDKILTILDHIAVVEAELLPEFSEKQLIDAKKVLDSMMLPHPDSDKIMPNK